MAGKLTVARSGVKNNVLIPFFDPGVSLPPARGTGPFASSGQAIRAIKQTMNMSVLRCKTPAMVRKEIRMHLPAYHLIRTLMTQAAE